MRYTPPVARDYVKRIRNAAKRQYAGRYLDYLMGNAPEPDRECSYMAAQAVRFDLHAIMAQCHSTT
jgi:hypothetical protein